MPRVGWEVDCGLCQCVCRMLCVQCWRAWGRPDGKGLVSSVALGKLVSPWQGWVMAWLPVSCARHITGLTSALGARRARGGSRLAGMGTQAPG